MPSIARQVSNAAHDRALKNPVTPQAVQCICELAKERTAGFTSADVAVMLKRLFPGRTWVPGTVSARIDNARRRLATEGILLENVRAEKGRQVMVARRPAAKPVNASGQVGLFGEAA